MCVCARSLARTCADCRAPTALAGAPLARLTSMACFDGSLERLIGRWGCSGRWVGGWSLWDAQVIASILAIGWQASEGGGVCSKAANGH